MRSLVVAVVDDNPGVRQALAGLLSAWGYRTELFASGVEFLEAAARTAADCLVVDIELGEISGLEVGRRLAAAGCRFPIIFITGAVDEAARHQAAAMGCIALLHKPFPGHSLLEAIVKATSRVPDADGSGDPA
jgi:FixJ family two-component response regulator